MITEQDIVNYISELDVLERTMRDLYAYAANNVTDKELKETFEDLAMSESKHTLIVDDLRQLAIKKQMES